MVMAKGAGKAFQVAGVKRALSTSLPNPSKKVKWEVPGVRTASGMAISVSKVGEHELPLGQVGEVRFGSAEEASTAVELLNGTEFGESVISVVMDDESKDGSKVAIYGIPDGLSWKELKEHCSQCGTVLFAGIATKNSEGGKNKGKGGGGALSGGTLMGEVRFETPEEAAQALPLLQGSTMDGINIMRVQADGNSQDGTKVIVTGIPAGSQWQELKDHCKQAGQVAFCAVEGDRSGSGKSFKGHSMPRNQGTGGGKGPMMQQMHQRSVQPMMMHQRSGQPMMMNQRSVQPTMMSQRSVQPMMMNQMGGGTLVGEVRYDDPTHAFEAMRELNGSIVGDGQIFIQADHSSQDGSKLTVTGIAPGTQWQELKDHFATIGQVAFAKVGPPPGQPVRQQAPMPGMQVGARYLGGAVGGGFRGPVGSFGRSPVSVTPRQGSQVSQRGGVLVGEIRYDDPQHAQNAVLQLNGSSLAGARLIVKLDEQSADQSKVTVRGVPASIAWQELKDHFASVGQVAFANIRRN